MGLLFFFPSLAVFFCWGGSLGTSVPWHVRLPPPPPPPAAISGGFLPRLSEPPCQRVTEGVGSFLPRQLLEVFLQAADVCCSARHWQAELRERRAGSLILGGVRKSPAGQPTSLPGAHKQRLSSNTPMCVRPAASAWFLSVFYHAGDVWGQQGTRAGCSPPGRDLLSPGEKL